MNRIIKDCAKVVLNGVQAAYVPVGRALGTIDFPVPPNSSMRKTSSRSIRHYYVSGIRSYLPIATAALALGVPLNRKIAVLDFGCGVGRQLLHFTKYYPAPDYHACDIDHTHIAFIKNNYPRVQARVSNFKPPLPFDDRSFDMIYSVSIFSHLHPDDHRIWLDELFRITKPGGCCFLTTEGPTALRMMEDRLGSADSLTEVLARDGVLYRDYDRWYGDGNWITRHMPVVDSAVGIDGRYGNTVLSPGHVRSEWPKSGFEVVQVLEGVIDHRQDLIALRRPA